MHPKIVQIKKDIHKSGPTKLDLLKYHPVLWKYRRSPPYTPLLNDIYHNKSYFLQKNAIDGFFKGYMVSGKPNRRYGKPKYYFGNMGSMAR